MWISIVTVSRFLASLLLTGCMMQPCRCTCPSVKSSTPVSPAVSAANTALTNGQKPGPGPASPPAFNEAATSSAPKLLAWDGDSTEARGGGWADCTSKPKCRTSIEAGPGSGQNNSTGIKFHGEGSAWLGGGWNFFAWYPANAGFDVSNFRYFKFAVRVAATNPQSAPDPLTLNVFLGCSGKKPKCASSTVLASEFSREDLLDGKWHQVVIPMSKLQNGSEFDPKTIWEFDVGTWSENDRNFDLFFDNLTFANE